MIAFFGEGRLGNQLFQLAFIQSMETAPQLFLADHFDELLELLEPIPQLVNLRHRFLKTFISKFAQPLLAWLSRARIFTSYKIQSYREGQFLLEGTTYTKSRGLFPFRYFFPCFAQSEKFFSPHAPAAWRIREAHLGAARAFLAGLPETSNKIFVHVRRGDYVGFSVLGKPDSALPLEYYTTQMRWFEENVENAYFIFLTDDPAYVERSLQDFPRKKISRESMYVDFAIMTLCQYGIMSNSSFSWWGAYLMKNRKRVVAPKYWLGWRSRVEVPRGAQPSFAEIADCSFD